MNFWFVNALLVGIEVDYILIDVILCSNSCICFSWIREIEFFSVLRLGSDQPVRPGLGGLAGSNFTLDRTCSQLNRLSQTRPV